MKPFIFEYLSEVLLEFFAYANISAGERYHIRYEKQEQVDEQYLAIADVADEKSFKVQTFHFNDYSTFLVNLNTVKLIVAACSEDVEVDFLTGLRNRVADNSKDEFIGTAILFIHNTSLDSLIGGCKSLSDTGMPLNIHSIKDSIRCRIEEDARFRHHQKALLNFKLNKVGLGTADDYSLFNYSVFLQVLGKGEIEDTDFVKLGLFRDKNLEGLNAGEMEKRLRKNEEWFNEISNGHQYGGLEKKLEKEFSQKGVERMIKKDWTDVDLTDLVEWENEKNESRNIIYLENTTGRTDDLQSYWDKPSGSTMSKSRIRNLIIFNPDHRDVVNITLNFDNKPKKQGLKTPLNLQDEEYQLSGRKILLNLKIEAADQIAFKYLTYEHPGFSAKYQFHILVLPFKEELVSEIKPGFIIKKNKKSWYLELSIEGNLVFNHGMTSKLSDVISNGAVFDLRENVTLELSAPAMGGEFDQEELTFNLNYTDNLIPFRIPVDTEKPQYISGPELRFKKWDASASFKYVTWTDPNTSNSVVTLTHGSDKYYCVDEFRENLAIEYQIINDGCLAYFQDAGGKLYANPDVHVDERLATIFSQVIGYYKRNNLLPSLTYIDQELELLLKQYVSTYCELLGSLQDGQPLSVQENNMLRIGTVQMLSGNKLMKFTPLHALNVAYQLQLKDVLFGGKLVSHLLDKLRPLNLVPYFKGEKKADKNDQRLYQPLEQLHSPEWLYYFTDETSSQQVSRFFVDKLVEQKIEQFIRHFRYLFVNPQAILRINLFNQGDTREILLGIFSYYARSFRKENLEEPVAIQVRIHGSKGYVTKFEEVALCDDYRVVERAFNIRLPKVSEPESLMDVYNKKVTFFKIDADTDYEYAHLSFFQFSADEVSRSTNNMLEVSSGISLDGLLADVPSISQKGAFRTGFGAGGMHLRNDLLRLTKGINALAAVSNTNDQYQKDTATAIVIDDKARVGVASVYKNSQWVTFIEPKVSLSFFKSYDDVVIIHYSDQYNNASGYDAITITSKWEPYKTTIMEVFQEQDIEVTEPQVIHVIDMFNTLNGEWLLGMNTPQKTNNPYYRLEKVSLLSAVKVAMALLHHEQITWVPISLEEVLRVSGAIGLKKADGLFSVKNLGAEGVHSDDLLFIGLEERQGEVHLYVYPWEVKIGHVEAGTITKAVNQSFQSASLIRKFLMEEGQLSSKIYRNFFAKLFLIGAEKCALYHIWPEYEYKWARLASYRSRLLNDEFKISTNLDDKIGYYGVIAFKWSTDFFSRSVSYEDDGCILTLLKQDGLDYLTAGLNDLSDQMATGELEGIPANKLLRNRYSQHEVKTDSAIEEEDENRDTEHDHNLDVGKEALPSSAIHVEVEHWERKALEAFADFDHDGGKKVDPLKLAFNRICTSEISAIGNAIYEKLNALNINVKKPMIQDLSFIEGPGFYRIEIKPYPTTTIKKIKAAAEELNIALHLPEESSVRIFSDRGVIWLEAPKKDEQKVKVTTTNIWPLFYKTDEFRVPFGADIEGKLQSVNFSSTNSPHLLLAGTTGSGKSVVLDTLIRSATKFYSPEELNVFLIDPKGNELIDFEGLPHFPKNNGLNSDDAIALLTEGVEEMDRRYVLFREIRKQTGQAAKDLVGYNSMVGKKGRLVPRWLIVLDEYADLLDENPGNKSIIETLLKRLSQKARAAGIHVVIATQKPLATIVSSVIKSNLTGVIALKVRTMMDSRVILDEMGAESLAGRGDCLFKNGSGQMVRVQAAIHE
jgi:DNA phosphorothioation-dependent restriction protein DptH